MIRDADPKDIPEIKAIWNHYVRDSVATFSSEDKTETGLVDLLNEKRANGEAFIVSCEGDTILGFATYGQFRKGNGYRHTYESTIYLSPNARGKGMGQVLLSTIEDHCRAKGGHSLIAAVTASNEAAVAFHKSLGYSDTALLTNAGYKYDVWHDLLLMQKML